MYPPTQDCSPLRVVPVSVNIKGIRENRASMLGGAAAASVCPNTSANCNTPAAAALLLLSVLGLYWPNASS
eukprot:6943734-Heterocapsa_arctica.AAC.1